MRKLVLMALAAAGLAIGLSGTASAAPGMHPTRQDAARPHATQQVDYFWQHERYHHRAWDRHHQRWHYY